MVRGGPDRADRDGREASQRLTRAAERSERLLLPAAVLVAALGVGLPGPGRAVDAGGGIDPTLAILVLAAGLSAELSARHRLRARAPQVVSALVAGTVGLPALAWALSRLAPTGVRDGLLALGVAPAEVASLALTGLAGGEVAVAAALLVGSTAVSVVASGPLLGLLAPAHSVRPAGLVATLALVVALPLALGAALGGLARRRPPILAVGRLGGVVTLLVLLWEVASQVHLDPGSVVATGLFLAFLGGAGALGALVAAGVEPRARPGLVLPVALRDFAVAAGIAAAAFDPGAAGPLGIYGLLVLVVGALAARRSPRRPRPRR
jgi:predicted Na+-dependent transporter